MPEARRRLEDGGFERVVARLHLSGSFLAAVRAASRNHELMCPHCPAEVHFVKPTTRAIAGTNEQNVAPHFRLASGAEHDENCPIKQYAEEGGESREYDNSLGWRIHLNTREFSSLYETRDSVYYRDGNYHLRVNQRRLPEGESPEKFISRAPFAVKNAKELIDLIARGNLDRLNDSYVVFEDKVVPWRSFFIREKRFFDLAQRLESTGSYLPVLMHFDVERGISRGRWDKAVCAKDKERFWKRNVHDEAVFLQTRVWLDNHEDSDLRSVFHRAGEFFVLGNARLRHTSGTLKTINVSLTSMEQVVPQKLDDLVAKVTGQHAPSRTPAND
ncbi:MAG: hypothetical protein AB7E85_00780 [Pseudobdellovibrionaceae bacterium]